MQEELDAERTKLTLATHQLSGARLQYDGAAQKRAEAEREMAALRQSVRAANQRADEMAAQRQGVEARICAAEASRDELRLLRATLASKLEMKDAQLTEVHEQLREAREQLAELREELQGEAPPGEASLHGARGRLQGFREAQAQLRAVRAASMSPRKAWEEPLQQSRLRVLEARS